MRTVLSTPESGWRVSSGSAAVLGIRDQLANAAPTTAYLMLGDRCVNNCAFCTQARDSRASEDTLSRVTWPSVMPETAVYAIAAASERGDIKRVCFQVTGGPDGYAAAMDATARVSSASSVPICVSIAASSLEEVASLLDAGAQRVTLALDATTPELYSRIKDRSWDDTWTLLARAARAHPGRIGTHLIAGLGETEEQFLYTADALLRLGISIALFAFTPVRGTQMADSAPPQLEGYRRIQAVLWLLKQGLLQIDAVRFDSFGRLRDMGMTGEALGTLLCDGDAFRTSGCPDCNRPYYNDRPGRALYNYPVPLTRDEARREIAGLLESLGI
ncbi:MAG: radical SAM protein [Anaerolineae bacterium]